MGEADFNQFMRLRNQLVNAAENFAREENLTPVLIPTMSRDMEEQLKLAHKVVDVVDRSNRKIWVTLLQYNVDKLEGSYAQVRIFERKEEDEKFQQVVSVNYTVEEIIYFILQKSTNPQNKRSGAQKFARNCVEQWTFGLHWAFKPSS